MVEDGKVLAGRWGVGKYLNMMARVNFFAGASVMLVLGWVMPARAAELNWERVAGLPVANAGFAHGAVEGKIVVAGGTTWNEGAKVVLDRAWSLDAVVNQWTELGRLMRPYAFGGYRVREGQLELLGGDDGDRTYAGGFGLRPMDDVTRVWTLLPEARAYVGSAVDGKTLYLLVGTPNLRELSRLTSSFLRVKQDEKIDVLPDFPGGAVMHAALVLLPESLLVFPGGTFDLMTRTARNTQKVYRYLPESRRWRERAPYPFAVRGLGACAVDERYILLVGGYKTRSEGGSGSALTAECFLYDIVADRYLPAPPLPTAAMLVGVERLGNFIYVIGGEDGERHRSSGVYRIDARELLRAGGIGRVMR